MPSLRDVGVAVVIASFYRAFVPAGRWALVSVFVLLYRAFVPAGRVVAVMFVSFYRAFVPVGTLGVLPCVCGAYHSCSPVRGDSSVEHRPPRVFPMSRRDNTKWKIICVRKNRGE